MPVVFYYLQDTFMADSGRQQTPDGTEPAWQEWCAC